jgi:epoxyqueuosine reductase
MEKLLNLINDMGWRGQIIPVDHLNDLRFAILNPLEQGLIDRKLYQEQLSFFSFDYPQELPGVRSIIIVAVPTPQMRVFFHSHGKRVPIVIPPTYVSYSPRTSKTQDALSGLLKQEGYHLAKTRLPLKTLAVYSGLAKYGRNNICYVDNMGSYLQLVGVFSDLPCDNDCWQQPGMLDRCRSCNTCLRNCPTKAINTDRFLLHAEKCLTYHNEAKVDFPGWINPSWHHCMIGCMRCQTICPENRAVIKWFEDLVEFSEAETILFIKAVPYEQLPREMVLKIKRLEINENYLSLCRNLKMILK